MILVTFPSGSNLWVNKPCAQEGREQETNVCHSPKFQILTIPFQTFEAVSRSKCYQKDYSIKERPHFHSDSTTQPRRF